MQQESGNKLVRKAGDKQARAHCPGIREEQRCENVTTNSPWSPNVTSPLHSTPLPPSHSAPVSPLSNLPLFHFFFLCTSFHPLRPLLSPLILWQRFPFHLLNRADGGKEQSKIISVSLTLLLSSASPWPWFFSICSPKAPFFSQVYSFKHTFIYSSVFYQPSGSWSLGQPDEFPFFHNNFI